MIEPGRQLADAGAQSGEPTALRRPLFGGPPGAAVDGACTAAQAPVGERLRLLVSTVESQIIPRLVIAHRPSSTQALLAECAGTARARSEDVDACVRLLLDPVAGPLVSFAEALMARGTSLDAIYLEVFAPAARRLGDMWERDECSFTDVTIALGRLQQSLRRFAAHFRPECIDGQPWRRAMFAAVPGEQHTLGLSMIVQYFLRAGWDASMLPSAAGQDLPQLVQQERVALVGLSMSRAEHAPIIKALIRRIRTGSCNPAVRVMVGGVAFSRDGGLAEQVGADGTATDAAQAVNLAQQLVL